MSNDYGGTITRLLADLKAGDQAAMVGIREFYFKQLMSVAQGKMSNRPKKASDEEDVLQSVFLKLWQNIQRGVVPDLNRRQLWSLLLKMTQNKLADQARRATRIKWGGGKEPDSLLEDIVSQEPSPDFVASMNEELQRLLEGLGGEVLLREVACRDLEGCTVQEIADTLQVSTRTVERRLELIRSKWEKELGANGNGCDTPET